MDKKITSRILCFDVMNVLACFAVVVQHHNSHMHSFDGSFSWAVSLVLECLCYWSVPIFLMVSGANLLDYRKKYDTPTFFRKRFLRVAVPWLIWSVILLIWKVSTGQIRSDGQTLLSYAQLVLSNNVEGIYWFFGTLFVLYLMTPVLTHLTAHRRLLWYMVIGIFLLSVLQPLAGDYLPIGSGYIDALRNSLLVYYLLGYLLNTTEFTRKQRIILYLMGIAAVVFRFSVSFFHSHAIGAASLAVRGNKMCNAMICSAALFVFLKQVDWNRLLPSKIQALLPTLASYSFGVYLLHRVVIWHLRELLGLGISSLKWKTICAPLTYVVCIAVIALLKKIPVIKKYIC